MSQLEIEKTIKLKFNHEFVEAIRQEVNTFCRPFPQIQQVDKDDFQNKMIARCKGIANRAFTMGLKEEPVSLEEEKENG